ncbi:kinesin-like protein [Mycena amicta]|nr:kinesin-like protein [Mycena amicta]
MTTSAKVKVIARLRPRLNAEPADHGIRVCHAEPADTSGSTASTSNSAITSTFTGISVNNPRDPTQIFRFPFTSAYDAESTQESIFDTDVRPLLDVALSGVTVTIFAYGVTSSGKTYTMQGTAAEPGVIPRVVKALFDKATSASLKTDIAVSYIEIYKDEVYDLLVAARESAPKLPVRENEAGVVFVAGLVSTRIASADEFDTLYSTATRRRSVGATHLNDQSSRSHAVLTLNLRTREGSVVREGKINLVDLAGSENNKQTGNDQSRMAESKAINKSLSTLGMVVHALNTGQTRIPYRDSKLTRLLQDALGGSSVGLLICNLAPSAKFRQDTLNTLNFAVRTKNIENKPVVNERDIRPPAPAPPRLDLAQMQSNGKTAQAALGLGRPAARPSLVPRPASRTSTFGVAGSRMSLVGLGGVGNRMSLVGAGVEKEKEAVPPGLSEAEIDARISKAVEAEVARRMEERERELEREKEKVREEWERQQEQKREKREREREEERSRSRSQSPKKAKVKVKVEKGSAPSSSSSKRSYEDDDALQARLRELERKFMIANKDNNDVELADALSPVTKKKTGRAYVALARTHQERGHLETALDLYRRAEAYVPGNTKLRDRIIEIEWSVKNGKAFKPSPKRKKAFKPSPKRKKASSSKDKSSKSSSPEKEEKNRKGAHRKAGSADTDREMDGKAKRTMDADEEMEVTPAKRVKREVKLRKPQRIVESDGEEEEEENVYAAAAPRKRGKGRSLRSAACA